MAHWTSVPSKVEAKPRSKGAALKQQLPENHYLKELGAAGGTPSTRASTAVAAQGGSGAEPVPPNRRIWRRPPATFRRRHHVRKMHAGTMADASSPGGGHVSDSWAEGQRAWSTEPSSNGGPGGQHAPFSRSAQARSAPHEPGDRAVTSLGFRDRSPESMEARTSARTESRAGSSGFTHFMASQGRYASERLSESPKSAQAQLLSMEPVPPSIAEPSSQESRHGSQEVVEPAQLETSRRSVDEPRLSSRLEYRPEVMERLARPRQRGASEQTKRRALSRAYEAFAQEAASALLPEAQPPERSSASALSFGDTWRTAGEDGYRSALFHAAVRCRQLQQGSGLNETLAMPQVIHGADGPELVVFNGGQSAAALEGILHAPELVRLHTACFVFEELCKVSSPLQDTLRFLFREMCSCIFEGFRPGNDVLSLVPFFVAALQAENEVEQQRHRAEAAEADALAFRQRLAELEDELSRATIELQALHEREKTAGDITHALHDEKNELRIEVTRLQTLNEIRADELRAMGKELSHTQGNASDLLRDLEKSKKSFNAITSVSKEQKNNLEILQSQVADLQLALQLASDREARESLPDKPHGMQETSPKLASPAEDQPPDMPELMQELAIRMQQVQHPGSVSGSTGQTLKVADHGRLLKMPRHDGGYQVVMRGSVEEVHGHAGGARASMSSTSSPVLIVSGDTFTALAIALALPQPPDPIMFKVGTGIHDDDDIVREVYREVQALATEHIALLELSRALRRDLKESLKLTKEWNRDEIRGVLQNVLVLDSDEVCIVPSPVAGSQALIGLGEEEKVPPFLRYDGVLKVKNMAKTEVERICQGIWLTKTQKDVEELSAGNSRISLAEYIGDVYVPSISSRRVAQMEHMYNLLLAIRQITTISTVDAFEKQYQASLNANSPDGQSPGTATPTRRKAGSSAVKRISGQPTSLGFSGAESLGAGSMDAGDGKSQQGGMLLVPGGFSSGRRASGVPTNFVVNTDGDDPSSPTTVVPVAHGKTLQAARPRMRLQPDINFNASAEVLYRTLMSELHEDTHHDQTSMLLALCHAFASLSEHLAPAHWNPPALVSREIEPAVIGLAEMSAVLRLFFPGKPREHLSEIKRRVMITVFGYEDSADYESLTRQNSASLLGTPLSPLSPPEREKSGSSSTFKSKKRPPDLQTVPDVHAGSRSPSDSNSAKEPLVLDVGLLMGVRMWRGQVVDTDDLLTNLIQEPTPFVLELRRQHVIECLMFLDRVQKAFRMAAAGTVGPMSDTGVPLVNIKQAEAALIQADPNLTEDQRRIYILRGFGRRLPDPPSIEGATDGRKVSGKETKRAQFEERPNPRERAARRAAVMYKTRYLLKDHVNQLAEENATVPTETFVKRLGAAGVCKGSAGWSPDVAISQVIKEAGLPLVRSSAASGPLEELLDTSNTDRRETSPDGGRRDASGSDHADRGESSKYHYHVTSGKDIQELSAGYPEFTLLHWLACPA